MKIKKWMRLTAFLLACSMLLGACGSKTDDALSETEKESETEQKIITETADNQEESTEIQMFIAASLSNVMEEIALDFMENHPEIKINFNADSSGTLLQQIEEGFACDIFFSAAQKQMNTLEEAGLVVDGTRANVVNNQVCVVTYKDSGTSVTGLADIGNASSIALADCSVPVGKYTRQAMLNLGMLQSLIPSDVSDERDQNQVDGETEETPEVKIYDIDAASISTAQIAEALGGVEISEQGNVSKVRTALLEGSCQVGTVYYSDTYGYEDKLDILEILPNELTGNVLYPICMVTNDEADEDEIEAARVFYEYILSDAAKVVFDKYMFDTNIQK